jgi:hypothetical protein
MMACCCGLYTRPTSSHHTCRLQLSATGSESLTDTTMSRIGDVVLQTATFLLPAGPGSAMSRSGTAVAQCMMFTRRSGDPSSADSLTVANFPVNATTNLCTPPPTLPFADVYSPFTQTTALPALPDCSSYGEQVPFALQGSGSINGSNSGLPYQAFFPYDTLVIGPQSLSQQSYGDAPASGIQPTAFRITSVSSMCVQSAQSYQDSDGMHAFDLNVPALVNLPAFVDCLHIVMQANGVPVIYDGFTDLSGRCNVAFGSLPDGMSPYTWISASTSSNPVNVGAIVGGVIGGLAGLAILGYAVYAFNKKRRGTAHVASTYSRFDETASGTAAATQPLLYQNPVAKQSQVAVSAAHVTHTMVSPTQNANAPQLPQMSSYRPPQQQQGNAGTPMYQAP